MKGQISRRGFLKGAVASAGLAGAGGAGLLHGLGGESSAASKIANPTLGVFPTAMCHAPMRMMYEKGFYKKYGPENFRLTTISDRDPVNEGLIGGKLQMAYGAGLEALILIDRGMPFVLTGGVHTGCIRAVAQPEIQSWKELKGKTLAVNIIGTFPYCIALSQIHEAGLDYLRDVKILVVSPPDMIPAFRQRKVDAIIMWDPIPMLIGELNIPHNMIWDMSTAKGWKDMVCCQVQMTREFVNEHPGMVWQFNKCLEAASHWLAESDDNIRECVDIQIKKKYVPGVAKADFQFRLIKSYDFSVAGDQERTLESIKFYGEVGKKFGAIKGDVKELVKRLWVDYTKLPQKPI